MEPFVVEDLDRSEHDDVRSLILDGLAEHWGVIDPSANPDLADILTAYANGRTVVVRNEEGTVVGTGTVVPYLDGAAQIVRVSVDRSVRRSGLGRRIVDELIATAGDWGAESVVLETTSGWTGVRAFYLDCGFRVTHEAVGDNGPETWFEYEMGGS